jgi:hypothetical protein
LPAFCAVANIEAAQTMMTTNPVVFIGHTSRDTSANQPFTVVAESCVAETSSLDARRVEFTIHLS